jgi:transcriptional regulator with XRE-family HTH domain
MTTGQAALNATRPGAELHALLCDQMARVFRGSLTHFARGCGTSPSLASKWLDKDPKRRKIPSPASCQKIADGLGIDADQVLAMAGHRRPANDENEIVDARRAALMSIVRDHVPDEDLGALERMLSAYRESRISGKSPLEYLALLFGEHSLGSAIAPASGA